MTPSDLLTRWRHDAAKRSLQVVYERVTGQTTVSARWEEDGSEEAERIGVLTEQWVGLLQHLQGRPATPPHAPGTSLIVQSGVHRQLARKISSDIPDGRTAVAWQKQLDIKSIFHCYELIKASGQLNYVCSKCGVCYIGCVNV